MQKDVGHASEGFYFVNNGVLVFHDNTMMIHIYEGETFWNGGYNSIPPALLINLLQTVASIEFKKIHSIQYTVYSSTRLNFEGGMMTITGVFNWDSQKIVTTIKMNRTNYKLLAMLLKEVGLWSNNKNDMYCYTKLQHDWTYF